MHARNHRFPELEHLPSRRRRQILMEALTSEEIRHVTARFSRWFIPGMFLPPVAIGIVIALLGLISITYIAIASVLACIGVSLSCSLLAALEYRAVVRTIRRLLRTNYERFDRFAPLG